MHPAKKKHILSGKNYLLTVRLEHTAPVVGRVQSEAFGMRIRVCMCVMSVWSHCWAAAELGQTPAWRQQLESSDVIILLPWRPVVPRHLQKSKGGGKSPGCLAGTQSCCDETLHSRWYRDIWTNSRKLMCAAQRDKKQLVLQKKKWQKQM